MTDREYSYQALTMLISPLETDRGLSLISILGHTHTSSAPKGVPDRTVLRGG